MRITTTILGTLALLLVAGCTEDGLSSTTRQIQSCYDTGHGYICVNTPEGASVQPRDVDGDGVLDQFMCADEDSDSDSADQSTSDSDLDSDSDGDGTDPAAESDSDDSDSDADCGATEDSDNDGDGVPDATDCDCIGNPGGGTEPTPIP